MEQERWWKKWNKGHQQKYACPGGCPSRSKIQWDGIGGTVFPFVLLGESAPGPTKVADNLVVMVKDNGRWGGSGSVDKSYLCMPMAGVRPT